MLFSFSQPGLLYQIKQLVQVRSLLLAERK
jgi:hypothetical protein